MLVVSRRLRQSLELGSNIHVTVLDIRSDQVRLGVDAPREVRVVRSELLEQIGRVNRQSASLQPVDFAALIPATTAPALVQLRVGDIDASVEFYQRLGFTTLGKPSRVLAQMLRGNVLLELKPGAPAKPFGFLLVESPRNWLSDPDGYSVGL